MSLQARGKWRDVEDNVTVGEVVVIHEDNLPPQKWLVCRVEEVDVGADGKVRVAAVRTANGVFKRSRPTANRGCRTLSSAKRPVFRQNTGQINGNEVLEIKN